MGIFDDRNVENKFIASMYSNCRQRHRRPYFDFFADPKPAEHINRLLTPEAIIIPIQVPVQIIPPKEPSPTDAEGASKTTDKKDDLKTADTKETADTKDVSKPADKTADASASSTTASSASKSESDPSAAQKDEDQMEIDEEEDGPPAPLHPKDDPNMVRINKKWSIEGEPDWIAKDDNPYKRGKNKDPPTAENTRMETHSILCVPPDCAKLRFPTWPCDEKTHDKWAHAREYGMKLPKEYEYMKPYAIYAKEREKYEIAHGTSVYNIVMFTPTDMCDNMIYAWNSHVAPHLEGETDMFLIFDEVKHRRLGKDFHKDHDKGFRRDVVLIQGYKEAYNWARLSPHKWVRIFLNIGRYTKDSHADIHKWSEGLNKLPGKQVDVFYIANGKDFPYRWAESFRNYLHTGSPDMPLCWKGFWSVHDNIRQLSRHILRNLRLNLSIPAKFAPGIDQDRHFCYPGEFVYFDKSPEYLRQNLQVYTEEMPIFPHGDKEWRRARGEVYTWGHIYQEYDDTRYGYHYPLRLSLSRMWRNTKISEYDPAFYDYDDPDYMYDEYGMDDMEDDFYHDEYRAHQDMKAVQDVKAAARVKEKEETKGVKARMKGFFGFGGTSASGVPAIEQDKEVARPPPRRRRRRMYPSRHHDMMSPYGRYGRHMMFEHDFRGPESVPKREKRKDIKRKYLKILPDTSTVFSLRQIVVIIMRSWVNKTYQLFKSKNYVTDDVFKLIEVMLAHCLKEDKENPPDPENILVEPREPQIEEEFREKKRLEPSLKPPKVATTEKAKDKERKAMAMKLRKKIKLAYKVIWVGNAFKKELKELEGLESQLTYNKHMARLLKVRGHGNPEWQRDMQSFLDDFNKIKSRIDRLPEPPLDECCRVTLSSFLKDLQSKEIYTTLDSDKLTFLKNMTISGIPCLAPVRDATMINPWTISIKIVGLCPYEVLSQRALENAMNSDRYWRDPKNKDVSIDRNDKNSNFNIVVPIIPRQHCQLLKPLVLSNIFGVACAYSILKTPMISDIHCHLAALAALWLKTIVDFPRLKRPEYIVNRIRDIEETARIYFARQSVKEYTEALWRNPALGVVTDATHLHYNRYAKCESLTKPAFLVQLSRIMPELVWKYQANLPKIVQQVCAEFICRCLKNYQSSNNTPFADFYLPDVEDGSRKKWLEQKASSLFEKLNVPTTGLVVKYYIDQELIKEYSPIIHKLCHDHATELHWNEMIKFDNTSKKWELDQQRWWFSALSNRPQPTRTRTSDTDNSGSDSDDEPVYYVGGSTEDKMEANADILPRPNMGKIAKMYRNSSAGNVNWADLKAWAEEIRHIYGVEQFVAGAGQQAEGAEEDSDITTSEEEESSEEEEDEEEDGGEGGSEKKKLKTDTENPEGGAAADGGAASGATAEGAAAEEKAAVLPPFQPIALVQQDLDYAFGNDMVSQYVVSALTHRTSVERFTMEECSLTPEKARATFEQRIEAEWKLIMEKELKPLILRKILTRYTEEMVEVHKTVAVPMNIKEIIRQAQERGVDVNADNFQKLYGYRIGVGLCKYACQQPACPYYLVPNKNFNKHMEVDRVGQRRYPHGLHITTLKITRDPNQFHDEAITRKVNHHVEIKLKELGHKRWCQSNRIDEAKAKIRKAKDDEDKEAQMVATADLATLEADRIVLPERWTLQGEFHQQAVDDITTEEAGINKVLRDLMDNDLPTSFKSKIFHRHNVGHSHDPVVQQQVRDITAAYADMHRQEPPPPERGTY